jgi:hypothetical protein
MKFSWHGSISNHVIVVGTLTQVWNDEYLSNATSVWNTVVTLSSNTTSVRRIQYKVKVSWKLGWQYSE